MPEISDSRYRAGEGEPLVLIHGFTATWRCWLPNLAFLVPHFDVIAPTLHGHDGGPVLAPGEAGHSFSDAADHAERSFDELGIETAHLAGNSLGGGIALELAKRGRARSVVAISPAGSQAVADPVEAQRIARFFRRTQRMAKLSLPRMPLLMRSSINRRIGFRDVMVRGDQMPTAEAVKMAVSSTKCTIVDEVLSAVGSQEACLQGLDTITTPTLVVWGTKDRVLPLAKHAPTFRNVPGFEFRELRGIGHTPMWDDPELVATTIRDFALKHSSATAEPAAAQS